LQQDGDDDCHPNANITLFSGSIVDSITRHGDHMIVRPKLSIHQ
jgi:hypothetical protein